MKNFSYDLRLEKLETHNIFIRMYIDDLQFQNNQLKIEINVLKGFIQDHCYYLHEDPCEIGEDIFRAHSRLPKYDLDICKNRFAGDFLEEESIMNSYVKEYSSSTITLDDIPSSIKESEGSISEMPPRKPAHILTQRKNTEEKTDLDILQKGHTKKQTKSLNGLGTPKTKKAPSLKENDTKPRIKKTSKIDLTPRDLESIDKGEPKRFGKKVLDPARKNSPTGQKEKRKSPVNEVVSKRELDFLGTPRTPREPTNHLAKRDTKNNSKAEHKTEKGSEKENISGDKISSRDIESIGKARRRSGTFITEDKTSEKSEKEAGGKTSIGEKENNVSAGKKSKSMTNLDEKRKLSLSSTISETIHNRHYTAFNGMSPRDIESLGKRQTTRLGVRNLKDSRTSNSILLKNTKSDRVPSVELEKIRRPMNIYARKTNVLVRVNVKPVSAEISSRDIESIGKGKSRKLSQTNTHKTIETKSAPNRESKRKLDDLKLQKAADDQMRREIESIGKRPSPKMIDNKKCKTGSSNSPRTANSPRPNIVKCVKREPKQPVQTESPSL